MATSTAAPLPDLPASPLGDLPANPLGAPPTPPLVGKRQPLRFPDLRSRNGGAGRSTRAPLPNLDVLNQRRRATRQAKKAQQAQTPTPAAPAAKNAAPTPTAPIVLRPQVAPVAPTAPSSATRRTARQARDEQLEQIHALFGPQLAEHPAFARADSRHQGLRSAAAHLRGYADAYHKGGMAAGETFKKQAQRDNPGYSPPEDREPFPDEQQPPHDIHEQIAAAEAKLSKNEPLTVADKAALRHRRRIIHQHAIEHLDVSAAPAPPTEGQP